ncbi:nucleotide-diphospho-sugar transferase [Sanghuangporus baumii]|uniref:Nucleotide-diphospho-sugar transferase n=1 Tax=Sanghuangporus baumii TaxID=108892 RepID=A0A9Q5HRH3_SANBA|nr:nucleotide-diphospho-sugar transferase [Sanghuangporus baumii]
MRWGYDYLPLPNNSSRRRPSCWLLGCLIAIFPANLIVLWWLRSPPDLLDTFRPLNSIPPVRSDIFAGNSSDPASLDIPGQDERAVVSTLYSESFTSAVLTLGRSLQNAKIAARCILLYIPERLSSQTLCQLSEIGWELRPIERIPLPNGGKGVHPRFRDQYSKLRVWSLDEIGIKSVIYLDGDMLVRQNFDELWGLPFEFAAVSDVYGDSRGFALSFNAGMMFLHTSSSIFSDMLNKIETAEYRRLDAEQGFLNSYFASQVVRLPHTYNANLVIKQRNPFLWGAIEEDMRIVHYTMMKPFISDERSRAIGIWEEELKHWDIVWQNVSSELMTMVGEC